LFKGENRRCQGSGVKLGAGISRPDGNDYSLGPGTTPGIGVYYQARRPAQPNGNSSIIGHGETVSISWFRSAVFSNRGLLSFRWPPADAGSEHTAFSLPFDGNGCRDRRRKWMAVHQARLLISATRVSSAPPGLVFQKYNILPSKETISRKLYLYICLPANGSLSGGVGSDGSETNSQPSATGFIGISTVGKRTPRPRGQRGVLNF